MFSYISKAIQNRIKTVEKFILVNLFGYEIPEAPSFETQQTTLNNAFKRMELIRTGLSSPVEEVVANTAPVLPEVQKSQRAFKWEGWKLEVIQRKKELNEEKKNPLKTFFGFFIPAKNKELELLTELETQSSFDSFKQICKNCSY